MGCDVEQFLHLRHVSCLYISGCLFHAYPVLVARLGLEDGDDFVASGHDDVMFDAQLLAWRNADVSARERAIICRNIERYRMFR